MSTTVDQRVVEMRFDNRQFEQNVSKTMSTLEKLKQGLNLTGASKGLEGINSASRGLNLGGLNSGVEAIQAKFSALQVMGITALSNITNSAVNAGKRIASALTIDPIKTGFQEYETQINAVQTILANTESKGTTLKDVNGALDQLNTYADKTIYNFTEMTRNIGTFTAAGVDLETSVSSIQGIANLAAVSGSTSQQASTAMYQLSQALAAGKVSLMDWNSVVNAGMGGQVFQDALKRTSEVMGTGAEAAIEQYGSFRESLTQGEWLTTDVLTKTLEQFTMAAEEGSKEWENYKKSLMDDGYTEKQAEDILKMANTATNAATKVKTVTQLWDTLKEAAQSGWTQTWEIIVGDFEEAREMLTNVSNVINDLIGKSSEARNQLLQGWKDLGGRKALIESFSNIFSGLVNIAKPIGEAFREIFPAMKPEQLMKVTEGFKKLTESFKTFTGANGDKIKTTFKGIFSILDIGITIIKAVAGGIIDLIKNFSGIGGIILSVTSGIGEWATKLREGVKENNIFANSVDFITNALTFIIDKIKMLGGPLGKGLSAAGKAPGEFINTLDFSKGLDVIQGGLFAGILLSIKKFIDGLKEPFEGAGGMFESISETLGSVKDTLESYQQNLQAGTLLKIAAAIGILALSLITIASIDGVSLSKSLMAISVLFVELLGSLKLLTMIGTPSIKGTTKAIGAMIGMSTAILILSAALKVMSGIDTPSIVRGLVAIGALMGMISLFLNNTKFSGKAVGSATSIVILSSAMIILAKAVKSFGSMSWTEIGTGLAAMGGALAVVWAAMKLMPKGILGIGTGLLIAAASMKVLAIALTSFGGMSGDEVKMGLMAMAGGLGALAIALNLMRGTLAASAALLIAAGALAILAPVLKSLGNMSLSQIGMGLLAMAGAFTVLGLAGLLLGPVVPSLLGLAGAIALFGAGCLAVGVGIAAFSTGLATLAVSGTAGIAALTAVITGIIGLIPAIATSIAEGIVAIVTTLANSVGQIATAIFTLVLGILETFLKYLPKIIDVGGELVVKFILGISSKLPDLIDAAFELIIALINGLADAINTHMPKLIEAGKNLGKAILNGFKQLLGINSPSKVFNGLGKNIVEGLVNGITSKVSSAVSAIKRIGTNCVNAITGFLSKFRTGAKNLMTAAIEGFSSKLTSAKNTVTNIITTCATAVGEKVSSFKTAGINAVQGFIDGLTSKFSAAQSWAANLGSSALQSIKNALGIASPSKEFAKVGMWSAEGLAGGLKKFAGKVDRAAAGVGDGAIGAMEKPLSNAADILSGNANMNPTITPVVDLSSVKSGANAINGMLGGNRGLGFAMNATGNISASMRRGQNGDNAVVSAINKLRSGLENVGNTSYVVNGVTYDDGSNVSSAVESLVRAARIGRRV